MKAKIKFEEFLEIESKLEIQIGQVTEAVKIPKTDKLIKLTVNFGRETDNIKTVVTALGEFYEPFTFIGKKIPFIMNLEPRKLGGVLSEAMILVGTPLPSFLPTLLHEISVDDYSCGTKIFG